MAEARKKNPQFTTPAGTFRFPKLNEPDYGNQKFPKPDGEYSVQLLFRADSDEAKALIKMLNPLYEDAMSSATEAFKALPVKTRKDFEKKGITGPIQNSLYSELYDKETEEPTGEIFFKFAMKASGAYKKGPKAGQKWHREPIIFDAKGNRMVKLPSIWGGTIGKVAFEVSPYFIDGTAAAGLRLGLNGVQILELVSAGSRSAASMGFGSEDGYEYSAEDAASEEKVASTQADDVGDDAGDF